MVESTPPLSGDDAIASIVSALELQLTRLDQMNLNIAAAHLDAAIQQLRTNQITRNNFLVI